MDSTLATDLFAVESTFPVWYSTMDDSASDRDPFHEHFDTDAWMPIFAFAVICFCTLVFVIGYSAYNFFWVQRKVTTAITIKLYSLLSILCFVAATTFFALYAINAKFEFGTLNNGTLSLWSIVELTHWIDSIFSIQPFSMLNHGQNIYSTTRCGQWVTSLHIFYNMSDND